MEDNAYILGTSASEIRRLQLQHAVWRPRMYEAWRRYGITRGQTVIDFGSGPGFASLDLNEIVGHAGQIIAIDKSRAYGDYLLHMATAKGASNIKFTTADIAEPLSLDAKADALWCRWVFSWLTDYTQALANIRSALKQGAIAIFHEYLDYATWSLAPRDNAFSHFVTRVIESVRLTGADIDSAKNLPSALERAGFEIVALNPIVDVITPADFAWNWPQSFARDFAPRLVELGHLTQAEATPALHALDVATRTQSARMVTPLLLEIAVRRR